jgi:hypothetical protein
MKRREAFRGIPRIPAAQDDRSALPAAPKKRAYLRMRLKSLRESLEHREQLDPDLQVGLYSCRAAASVSSWSSSG